MLKSKLQSDVQSSEIINKTQSSYITSLTNITSLSLLLGISSHQPLNESNCNSSSDDERSSQPLNLIKETNNNHTTSHSSKDFIPKNGTNNNVPSTHISKNNRSSIRNILVSTRLTNSTLNKNTLVDGASANSAFDATLIYVSENTIDANTSSCVSNTNPASASAVISINKKSKDGKSITTRNIQKSTTNATKISRVNFNITVTIITPSPSENILNKTSSETSSVITSTKSSISSQILVHTNLTDQMPVSTSSVILHHR